MLFRLELQFKCQDYYAITSNPLDNNIGKNGNLPVKQEQLTIILLYFCGGRRNKHYGSSVDLLFSLFNKRVISLRIGLCTY